MSEREMLEIADRVSVLADEIAAVAVMALETLETRARHGEKSELRKTRQMLQRRVRRLGEIQTVIHNKLRMPVSDWIG